MWQDQSEHFISVKLASSGHDILDDFTEGFDKNRFEVASCFQNRFWTGSVWATVDVDKIQKPVIRYKDRCRSDQAS